MLRPMPARTSRPDLYISADVETDGPIPGEFSLLSFGLCVAGSFDGQTYSRKDPEAQTFYTELKPSAHRWEQEALEVNGLDRDWLAEHGEQPEYAMERAAQWVQDVSTGHRAVLVAYPVAFDWAFLYWYFVRFARSGSPFGFSSCLDIRTLYQARSRTVHDLSGKDYMPPSLRSRRPHTHGALDDALEQADLFSNVFEWSVFAGAASAPGVRANG
jgi:DNA polymerase III epsilon subunit-like protein